VGDEVPVQTAVTSEVAELVGIARFGSVDSPAGVSVVLFDTETAARVLRNGDGGVAGIGIVAAPGEAPAAVRERVAMAAGPQVEVVTGAELTDENRATADRTLGYVRTFLLVFALISVAVGAFVIYTSFSFIVAQQQHQVAVLRAIGGSRTQVLAAIAVEALLVGLLASAVGFGAGVGLATLLGRVLVEGGTDLVVTPASAALALGVGTVATVGSAFFPALKAARVPPVAVMRDVAVDTSYRSPRRIVAGLLVGAPGAYALARGAVERDVTWSGGGALAVFLAAVLLGPVVARPASVAVGAPLPVARGIVGRLAQQNAARNAKRTASTASALMVGVGVVTLVMVADASMRASIDELVDAQFRGDFVVDGGAAFGFGGLPPEVVEEVAALPEVAAATGIRFGFAVVDGETATVGGLDAEAAGSVLDLEVTEGDLSSLGVDGFAVVADEARRHGWQVGDVVTMSFTDTGIRPLTLRALLGPGSGDLTGDYVMDVAGFAANFPESSDVQVWARLAEGVDPADAEPVLARAIADQPAAELQDVAAYKEATKSQFDPVLVLVNVLLALTVLVAMVGIVNTMVLSIVERRREIGLVRAVGGLRGQVRAAIRWEALLISTFGLAAAIGVGVGFGWVLVRALTEQGFTTFAVPGLPLVVVTTGMLVLTLVASLVPAVWAGRRDILAALATE
jgi:putative ABC transport system permease protein